MPRKKSRKPTSDPMGAAMSIFAVTAATDEEYAAGLHLKTPKAVMRGKKTPGKKAKRN